MRVLVVYESGYGQAEKVAHALAAAVRDEGHSAEVARASTRPSLAGVEAVIVGGSVRIGKHQEALVDWCRAERDALVQLPGAFFSVSVSARRRFGPGQREVAKALSRFIGETGWTPLHLWPIAGGLRYTQYSLPIKAMLVFIALLSGGDTDTSRDHEYTDWPGVAALGRGFARGLGDHAPLRGAGSARPERVAVN